MDVNGRGSQWSWAEEGELGPGSACAVLLDLGARAETRLLEVRTRRYGFRLGTPVRTSVHDSTVPGTFRVEILGPAMGAAALVMIPDGAINATAVAVAVAVDVNDIKPSVSAPTSASATALGRHRVAGTRE